mmetsp:Transcript_18967/g.24139  ORF Transcript_18967/g.24139 Transcript_18967/m.24139 type:complete len:97 (-) Transcript_18967:274-564(-)
MDMWFTSSGFANHMRRFLMIQAQRAHIALDAFLIQAMKTMVCNTTPSSSNQTVDRTLLKVNSLHILKRSKSFHFVGLRLRWSYAFTFQFTFFTLPD